MEVQFLPRRLSKIVEKPLKESDDGKTKTDIAGTGKRSLETGRGAWCIEQLLFRDHVQVVSSADEDALLFIAG